MPPAHEALLLRELRFIVLLNPPKDARRLAKCVYTALCRPKEHPPKQPHQKFTALHHSCTLKPTGRWGHIMTYLRRRLLGVEALVGINMHEMIRSGVSSVMTPRVSGNPNRGWLPDQAACSGLTGLCMSIATRKVPLNHAFPLAKSLVEYSLIQLSCRTDVVTDWDCSANSQEARSEMKSQACIALLCLILLQGCSAFSWKPCTDVESKSSIKNVGLTPDPPYGSSSLKSLYY